MIFKIPKPMLSLNEPFKFSIMFGRFSEILRGHEMPSSWSVLTMWPSVKAPSNCNLYSTLVFQGISTSSVSCRIICMVLGKRSRAIMHHYFDVLKRLAKRATLMWWVLFVLVPDSKEWSWRRGWELDKELILIWCKRRRTSINVMHVEGPALIRFRTHPRKPLN